MLKFLCLQPSGYIKEIQPSKEFLRERKAKLFYLSYPLCHGLHNYRTNKRGDISYLAKVELSADPNNYRMNMNKQGFEEIVLFKLTAVEG